MKVIQIQKKDWAEGLRRLREDYRLFGPVKDKEFHLFRELNGDELPDLAFSNTRLSPKSIVYPQSEALLTSSGEDRNILTEVEKDYRPRAVIGIRPCDAKAYCLVRLNFDTPEHQDPYWLKAYEATVLVGLGCNDPCGTCFCTTAGSGPLAEEGLDILLADAGDRYIAKLLTPKGERLARAAEWEEPIDVKEAEGILAGMKTAAEEKIVSAVETDRLRGKSTTELYAAPFWEEVAFSCINCGTCTFSCPTCWCFDIQDEVSGSSATRIRNWDSCMFPLFTLHGSGHNPRGTPLHRVRQWFVHKLKYFVDKYDKGIQCVGCGRCVRLCPVNIDIRSVCERMNASDACPAA
jgi:sulfhydrogenase subunit beta (sulfur reductase)